MALLCVAIAAAAGEQGRQRDSLERALRAYDAMTTSRPYRPTPMSPEGALSELRMSAGTQFDPLVVAAFEATRAQRGVSAAI